MWLVSDWLSFAGVSVPALLLVETNSVPTNRKRAEADASCLRYTCVLTELALGQFGRIKVLRFCTFSPLKPLESRRDSWSLCSKCRCSHKAIWKWYKMHDKWPHGTIRKNKSLCLADLLSDGAIEIKLSLKRARAEKQEFKQCRPYFKKLWIL